MYSIETARGAEWLKWDCHIHTPYSYTNKFNKFSPGNCNDEKMAMDRYIEELKQNALNHHTDVVVLNDYFTLEGYSYITKNYCQQDNITKSYYLNVEGNRKLYILPGIELRIDNFTDDNMAVNLHIFFNQKLSVEQIQDNFLHKLKFKRNGIDIELTKENLIKIGKCVASNEEYKENLKIEDISECNKKSFLNKAYESMALNYNDIIIAKEILEKKFCNDEELANNCCVLVMPFKGHGSIGGIDLKNSWDGRRGGVKLELMRASDIFYTANLKDIEFLRSESGSRNMCGNIKPCIWGSDSHEYDTLCHPSRGNTLKYTWVKGIPSFDGFKQILLEPYGRVSVGESYPKPKMEYKVIDSIRFISEGTFYPAHEILLNEGLNTIVGGKSSGKSLLLNCIASAVNGSGFFNYKKLQDKCDFDFQVKWKSGDLDSFNTMEEKRRKIKYVSQMYAANFVEDSEKLDKEVLDILMEDKNILDIHIKFKKDKEDIDNKLNTVIFELEQHINKRKECMESAKAIGEMDSLDRELNKLIERKEKIIQESQMTEEEGEEYRKLVKSQKECIAIQEKIQNTYIQALESHITYIESMVEPVKKYLGGEIQPEEDELDTHKVIYDVYKDIANFIETRVEKLKEKQLSHVKSIEESDSHEKAIKTKLIPYEEKMKQRETLENLNKDIEKIEKLKSELKILLNQVQEVQDSINKSISTFVASLNHRIEVYKSFIHEFNSLDALNMDENTSIVCVYKIKNKELYRRIGDILNNSIVDNKNLLKNIEDSKFITEDKVYGVEALVSNILNGYHGCKGNYNYMDLIRCIMRDYYVFKFDIIENDTSFFEMSPGKKGLIVLKLILHMSNETYPILLDQPEDNLDNRTISTELQKFIKEKKIDRQIIMVTHNANLAVLTDSEEIIVANQRGSDETEQKTVFDYVTGPIELSFINKDEKNVLHKKGIKEHVCDILEGGTNAFKERESKYEIDRMIAREKCIL